MPSFSLTTLNNLRSKTGTAKSSKVPTNISILNSKVEDETKFYLIDFLSKQSLLFGLGVLFSIIITTLLNQHNISRTINKNNEQLWLPIVCGFSASFVGSIFPFFDHYFGISNFKSDWSGVIRCCGGFFGVNYAASKLPWTSSVQVSITLALLGIGLWFLFDRTIHGFILSLVFSTVGTWVGFFLAYNGTYTYTKADFFGVRSWLPAILYCGCVCFGAIGRQLENSDIVSKKNGLPNSTIHYKRD
ncbi:Insulin-induced protein 1 protein [Clydaea vesicula]|uniref:Insulin-induced protein 1 protein n=1 Tax=Clydaea vesicula TaxID=447962 RepID=A0AAD5UBG9_9FUNG|nr:Insulin-induced protein 1 protein [Clydaea vesicula]